MPVHILAHTYMDWNTSSSKGCQKSETFGSCLVHDHRGVQYLPPTSHSEWAFLLIIKSFPSFRYELIDKGSAFAGLLIVLQVAVLFLEHRIYAPADRKVKFLLKWI